MKKIKIGNRTFIEKEGMSCDDLTYEDDNGKEYMWEEFLELYLKGK